MLEWDPSTGNWKEFGKLSHKKNGHAMSVVDLNDVEQYCAQIGILFWIMNLLYLILIYKIIVLYFI